MNEKTPAPQPKGNARRQLVRGAFAAPAVLTLFSGGALAASSNTRCLAKQNATPINPVPVVTNASDIYFRYQLWELVSGSTVYGYYIKGADLAGFARAGQTPFLPSTQWQQFDIVNNVTTGSPTTTAPAKTGYTLSRANKFVVLRVNSTGALVGAGSSGSSGATVNNSCWNSFAASTGP